MSQNKLTVVIPSRTLSNLQPCQRAVDDHDDCSIIAVWDRSRGNPHKTIPDSNFDRVIYVDDDFIFARNCNIGIAAADPEDDIVLLNDDALLRSSYGFAKMQHKANLRRDVGIIGAVTNVSGQPLQHPMNMGLREVPFFAFVCVLIPRRTIATVGLLDERYCIDYGVEDNDYCEAVKRAGMTCAVDDDCFVDHASLVSSYRGAPEASRSFAENLKLFCQKWGVTQ
jgi:GT2 family glycosyltransferase